MRRKNLRFLAVLMTVAIVLLGMGVTVYAASDTPTRTTPIDLTKITGAEDHLKDEGWAWKPSEKGGTLTLENFYQKAEHNGNGLIFGNGDIIIELVGDNTIETTSDLYQPLIFGDDVNWTVRGNGKLTLKMPDSTKSSLPYGFFGNKLTIESGDIHSEMVMAMPYSFEMSGGSVTVDKGTGTSAAIQALMGDVKLTGGKINISGSVCGIAASWDSTEIVVDGADVSIDATVVALSGKKITYKNGNLDIAGGTRATNVPIQTTIKGTGTLTDGTKNQPYDSAEYKNYVSFVAKHQHEGQPGVWKSDEEKHWSVCECGEVMESEAHQYTEKHDGENHWQECVCGKKKDVEAHTFGEWVKTKEATQTEVGQEMRKCSTCGYEESKEVAKLPAKDGSVKDSQSTKTDTKSGATAKSTKTSKSTQSTSPKTGDSAPIGTYAVIIALCGAALLLMWRKRVKASRE